MFDWLRYLLGGVTRSGAPRVVKLPIRGRGGYKGAALFSRVLRGLPLLSRTSRSVFERRNEYIAQLEHTAAVEEDKNAELETQLAFKKREDEVLRRIRVAKSRKGKLGELLHEYDTRRRLSWELLLIGVVAFLLLLLVLGQC